MTHALTLPVPSSAGSIEAYIQAAQRAPLLSEEDEFHLARQFRETGDLGAARRLVLSHLRLVISVARGYLGYGLPHADLIQEGNVGLMKAVKRFDPARGIRLVSFALHWIKAEIHEYILKNWRLVKVATTKAQRKLFFNLRRLKNSLTHEASLSSAQMMTIAEKLGVKPEEVREMEGRMSARDLALEGQADDGEEIFAPIDYLADSRYEPTRVIESRDYARLQDEGLHDALKVLDARSRRIIEARWLPADGGAATLHELAAEFQVSAERIRQIEVKALQKMRQSIKDGKK
ncbi:MAG: RNA polymerase sigma factor RpoH [Zoogloeaceae bacterium]|jgi:RNA polymerase sigma-32 factor|nr:RNA polymerase sigma factor RpoH [Zoogloeaceae bacterium]